MNTREIRNAVMRMRARHAGHPNSEMELADYALALCDEVDRLRAQLRGANLVRRILTDDPRKRLRETTRS